MAVASMATDLETVASVEGGVLWRHICEYLPEDEVFHTTPLVSRLLLQSLQGFPIRLDAVLEHAVSVHALRRDPPHWVLWKLSGIRLDAGGSPLASADLQALDLRDLAVLTIQNLDPAQVGDLGRILDTIANLRILQLHFHGDLPADEISCSRLVSVIQERLARFESFETNLLDLPGPSRGMIRVAWSVATYEQRRNPKSMLAAIEPLLHAPRPRNPFTANQEASLGLIPNLNFVDVHDQHIAYHKHEREILNALLEMCLVHASSPAHLVQAVRGGADALLFGIQLALNFANDELQEARAHDVQHDHLLASRNLSEQEEFANAMERQIALIKGRFNNSGLSLDGSLSNSMSMTMSADLKRPHQSLSQQSRPRPRHSFRPNSYEGATGAVRSPRAHDSVESQIEASPRSTTARVARSAAALTTRSVTNADAQVAAAAPRTPMSARWPRAPAEPSPGGSYEAIAELSGADENDSLGANRAALRVQVPADARRGRAHLISPTSVSSMPAIASSPMDSFRIPMYGPASSRSSSLNRSVAALPAHLRVREYTGTLVHHLWHALMQRLRPSEIDAMVRDTRTICHYTRGMHTTGAISLVVSILAHRAARDRDFRNDTFHACELLTDLAQIDPKFDTYPTTASIADRLLDVICPESAIHDPNRPLGESPIDVEEATTVCRALCHIPHLVLSSRAALMLSFLASRAERILLGDPETPELRDCDPNEETMVQHWAQNLIHIVQTLTLLMIECDFSEARSKILVPRTLALVFEIGLPYLVGPPDLVREISLRILDGVIYLCDIGMADLASCEYLVSFIFDVLPTLPDEYIFETLEVATSLVAQDASLLKKWMTAVDDIVREPNPESVLYPELVTKIFEIMGTLVQDVNSGFVTACQCLVFLFTTAEDTGIDVESLDIVLYHFQALLEDFFDDLSVDSRERLCAALSRALLSVVRLLDVRVGSGSQALSRRIHSTLAWCMRDTDDLMPGYTEQAV
ncbi:Hypothetical Protein FCC1311_065622 [Hondaea fermentalgiana]|uniref:Uncharacterized protein n=1 Tax=Hondaea fermentalgiana TaxID=2315210 RepID=A0A2R5GNX8_9STRA|nr:Hypothetical Protein FCC1311_065622 [Hondaea fermentalgiana]|eukprot:GBG30343.1 Hypothetical Protein FCC1311_065622 [Hondaea fermentalgiana]